MLINLRNALMAGKRLPYDAEIEYLENVVGAWIDTGFVQSSKALECVMSISVPEAAKLMTDFDPLFGNEQSDSNAMFVLAKQQKAPYLFWRAGSTSNLGVTKAQTSVFFEASLKTDSENGYTRTVGTSTLNGTYSGSVVGAANPMAIFAVRLNNSVDLPNTAGYRIASLQIYQDNLLVRDYIPVRRGAVGYLYDRVSGKLFGNAGTGDFVLGPDVVPVEYIESHGTEWIDTGVAPSTNDIYGMDTTFKVVSYNDGCCGSNGLGGAGKCYLNFYGNGLYVRKESFTSTTADRDNWNQSGYYFPAGWNRVKMTDDVVINGNVVKTGITLTTNRNTNPIYLFAYNAGGVGNLSILQIANCAITRGSALVRKFLPIRVGSGSTWEGAMMDTLTRRIYRNAGTGAFSYGNDLKYPIPTA